MWGIRNSAKARVGHVSDAFHAARSRDDRAREQIDATQYCIGGNKRDDTSPRPCLPNQSLLFVLRSRTVHDRMAPHHDLKTSRRCFINASHIRSLLEVHTACFQSYANLLLLTAIHQTLALISSFYCRFRFRSSVHNQFWIRLELLVTNQEAVWIDPTALNACFKSYISHPLNSCCSFLLLLQFPDSGPVCTIHQDLRVSNAGAVWM